MSYNHNFYNNFPENQCTFQNMRPNFVPAPPCPPSYFMPPIHNEPELSAQDYVNQKFGNIPLETKIKSPTPISITEVKGLMRNLVLKVNSMKERQKLLSENLKTISEDEWNSSVKNIELLKEEINKSMAQINDTYLNILRKLLAKRSAKRLRLKRVRMEKRREKELKIKMMEERSRKIDENLQRIKDDITKAKQEEESKRQADIVLKEVIRKKADAKRSMVKLEALAKLRRAREGTAKGRGGEVPNGDDFYHSIEKLKSMWSKRLAIYEQEEAELRKQLKENTESDQETNQKEKNVFENLEKWQHFLFGGEQPRRDFGGDCKKFVDVRSKWDQFMNKDGTPIPVGWVVPNLKFTIE